MIGNGAGISGLLALGAAQRPTGEQNTVDLVVAGFKPSVSHTVKLAYGV
jgi:hypothetical protein